MKLRYKLLLLLLPFLVMVLVNESMHFFSSEEKPFVYKGFQGLNSGEVNKNKCTWYCHADTTFCKNNHVKYLKPYFEYTDPVYFGIINALHKTGNYGLANIIFFVILIPLMIWYLLVKCIDYQLKIRKLKGKK